MNMPKITSKIFAFLLIALWSSYVLINLFSNAPLIWARFSQGWSIATKLENTLKSTNERIFYQGFFQEYGGYLANFLGKQTSNNFKIVKGDNSQLIYLNFYPYETYSHLAESAFRIRELNDAAQKQGASLLYLNCIDLHVEEGNMYGSFPVWDFNTRSDAFIYYLQSYGVQYLDTRDMLKESDLTIEEYRYKTEPHWTTQASFEVYLRLLAKLNEKTNKVELTGKFSDKSNFARTKYPQSYVGKLGKITGIPFSGYDDFVLIVPNFTTDFTMSYLEEYNKPARKGDYSSTLLDMNLLDSADPYERDMYSSYLNEVYPFRKIQNNLNLSGPKILIIGDSYMLPVVTFLATAASEIHLFWPYTPPLKQKSLVEYVKDNKFDYIIIGLSPMTLYENGLDFLNGIDIPVSSTTVKQ